MRIEDLDLESANSGSRARATVVWENSERAPCSLYFEVPEEFSTWLQPRPEAFLLAALVPAMRHGEKRLKLAGELCPRLYDGLETAAALLRCWYPRKYGAVQIEPAGIRRSPEYSARRHAACFLSGGVDSLATLRQNKLTYSGEHPFAIQSGIIVRGFDIHEQATAQWNLALAALREVARDAEISLIPVFTNLRELEGDLQVWVEAFHGAALAAVSQVLVSQIDRAYIGSTYDLRSLEPWGSHPLLDVCYGTTDLEMHHDLIRMSRLDKLRLLADWPVGLNHMRVCTHDAERELNCGQCEKCLRTMTGLCALGALNHCQAFQKDDVTADMLLRMPFWAEWQVHRYQDIFHCLEGTGRQDLMDAISRQIRFFRRKERIKRLDRKFLAGGLTFCFQKMRAAFR